MHKHDVIKVIDEKYPSLGIDNVQYYSVCKVGEGENNLNFLVTIDNKYKCVFRIGMRKEFEKNVQREFEWLNKIPLNFGPLPLVFDKSKKILKKVYSVLSYIDGKHVHNWTKKHLKMHAEKLAELHKKKYNFCGKKINEKKRLSFFKDYFKSELGWYRRKAKWIFKDPVIGKLYPVMEKYAKDNAHYFDNLKKFSMIHSDPDVANILFTKNGIRYIDWEWVQMGDPARDVAQLFFTGCRCPPWKIQLDGEKLNYYINTYIKKAKIKDKTFRKRVLVWSEIQKFNDLIYFIWKLKNYDKEHVKMPKQVYVQAIEGMKRSLAKTFLH